MSDDALFPTPAPTRSAGRVRRGLDSELRRAKQAGRSLPPDLVALARTLADSVDAAHAGAARSGRPYDHGAVGRLSQTYAETRATLFGGEIDHDAPDPFAAFLADISRPTLGDPAKP